MRQEPHWHGSAGEGGKWKVKLENGVPTPPPLLEFEENKGLANWVLRKCMKTKGSDGGVKEGWHEEDIPHEAVASGEWRAKKSEKGNAETPSTRRSIEIEVGCWRLEVRRAGPGRRGWRR